MESEKLISAGGEGLKRLKCQMSVQGADNKLGQFLNQDIYRPANHRNNLRHSLESCPSLV
jgi:hypothetical protein